MGRTTPNWNKKFLYQAVSVILPRGGNEWLQVIEMYQKLSGETNSREVNSARKQWHDVCCNKMQKPTGRAFSAGDGRDLVGQCQAVQLQIIEKTEGNMLGVNSVGDASTDDSSNDVEDSENDEEEELEANIMEANDNLDDLMEAGQATPVVLHFAVFGFRGFWETPTKKRLFWTWLVEYQEESLLQKIPKTYSKDNDIK